MTPAAIVEQFDIIEDRAARLGSSAPLGLIDQFDLKGGKEALCHRIIPAIASATHTADDSVFG